MGHHYERIHVDQPDDDLEYPVLGTKLVAPTSPGGYIRRNRLLDKLTLGVTDHPLTLLSAPAGFGKSVLAASWASANAVPWPVGWLSVDDADDRAETFWTYAMAALTRHVVTLPHLSRAPRRLGDGDQPFLAWLAADLLAQPKPVVLIVDDADRLTNRAVLSGLDFLLSHATPRFRLVLCSRPTPCCRCIDTASPSR